MARQYQDLWLVLDSCDGAVESRAQPGSCSDVRDSRTGFDPLLLLSERCVSWAVTMQFDIQDPREWERGSILEDVNKT